MVCIDHEVKVALDRSRIKEASTSSLATLSQGSRRMGRSISTWRNAVEEESKWLHGSKACFGEP